MSEDTQESVNEIKSIKQKLTPEEKARNKKEYNREWYLRNKEKKDEQSKKYYKEHTESAAESNLKLQERYRECYRILKDIVSQLNVLPEEYKLRAEQALNIGKNTV